MIDPLLSVAFSVHANPGVYALLLGSGLSRSAGIPTGYEIILQFIERLAHAAGEQVPRENLEEWYLTTFGKEPQYGELLDNLAKTSAERGQLLRGFFEPTEAERESGAKTPTPAHRAVAALVAGGFIRIVITTNFDRLMEQALEDQGIVPTVIASTDAIKGALPLAHSSCTIIKVHGDYRDARIKNTPEELALYDRPLRVLLDQVLDEYGLIVCGWSADWDIALRAALERSKNHRFTTYWAVRGAPSSAAQELITRRRAQVIQINTADAFFQDLQEKILALAELDRPHPLTPSIAVQTLKRYLPNPEHRIRLHDFVMDEVQRVADSLSLNSLPTNTPWSTEEFNRRVRHYETSTESLIAVLAAGAYYGDELHENLWIEAIRRLYAAGNSLTGGVTAFIHLRLYPALLAVYATGISALAAGKYHLIGEILNLPVRNERDNSDELLVLAVNTHDVIEKDVGEHLPGMQRHFTPVSDYLHGVLQKTLLTYMGDDVRYTEVFDRFEYLLFLVYGAEYRPLFSPGRWGPIGSFGWRHRSSNKSIVTTASKELEVMGPEWPPLKCGVLRVDAETAKSLKKEMDEFYYRVAGKWF